MSFFISKKFFVFFYSAIQKIKKNTECDGNENDYIAGVGDFNAFTARGV